jgi:DNA-binding NtrC family response regulator
MPISTILTVTSDDTFLGLLRQQLCAQAGSRGRMIVARSMNEASALLAATRPRLIVVHWTGDRARYRQLDRLLWTTSVLARRTPVLVIAERYRIDQATMMYRMGVAEYISRTHHLDQLAQVFDAYLHPSTMAMAQTSASVDGAGQPDKAWGSNHAPASLTAQVG